MASTPNFQVQTLQVGGLRHDIAPPASSSPSSTPRQRKNRWPGIKRVLKSSSAGMELEDITGTKKGPSPSSSPKVPPRKRSRWPAIKNVLRNSSGNSKDISVAISEAPDYCDMHVPVHSSFSDEQSLGSFLEEVKHKDEELREYLTSHDEPQVTVSFGQSEDLSEERDEFETSFLSKPKQTPDELHQYQEFVNSFLNLFLQSKFSRFTRGISPEYDPDDLIVSLVNSKSCPNIDLFRRIAVDPKLIGSVLPDGENSGYAENGVAVNQLAKFFDVAVLQFLSTVNENTDTHSILWALDYMKNLLVSLISSMNTLNSFGWYGAPHIRIRKGTNMGGSGRSSILQPPIILNPPPVVVVGTPPTSPRSTPERIVSPPSPVCMGNEMRDPVTGQRSPVLSPLSARSPLSVHQSMPSNSSKTHSDIGMEPGSDSPETRIGSESCVITNRAAEGSGRNTQKLELQGILKSPSLDSALKSAPRSPARLTVGGGGGARLHGILKAPSLESSLSPKSASPSPSPSPHSPRSSSSSQSPYPSPSHTPPYSPSSVHFSVSPSYTPPHSPRSASRSPSPLHISSHSTRSLSHSPDPLRQESAKNQETTHLSPSTSPRFSPDSSIADKMAEEEGDDDDDDEQALITSSSHLPNSTHSPTTESPTKEPMASGRKRKVTPANHSWIAPSGLNHTTQLSNVGMERIQEENEKLQSDSSHSLARPAVKGMERIQEEEEDKHSHSSLSLTIESANEEKKKERMTFPMHSHSRPPTLMQPDMDDIQEQAEDEEEELFQMEAVNLPVPPSTTSPPSKSLSPPPSEGISERGLNENSGMPTWGSSQKISPFSSHSGSPIHSALFDERRNLRASSLTPPPIPKDIPDVDVNRELETLVNGEGRISLLALLRAIARFPWCKEIWTREVSEKCFSLIQVCMDIGLPQQKEDTLPRKESIQDRRRRFFRQENSAFNKIGAEKPWRVHGSCIIEFSVNALIQCGVCSITGCSTDANICQLKQFYVPPSQGSAIHSRLIRSMRRIQVHSPAIFRDALIKYVHPSMSSCRRLFQFLHVVLQYCAHSSQEVYFNNLLASIVAAVLSGVVDRLVALDITEVSIQETIIKEACSFISYSNQLFCHDTVAKTKVFQHFHMYIHRIALSVILPPRIKPRETDSPLSPIQQMIQEASLKTSRHVDTTTGSTSKDSTPTVAASSSKTLKTAATSSPKIIPHLPKQSLIKQKSMGLTGTVTSSPLVIRKRSSSLHLSTSAPQPETALSKGGGAKSGKSPLLKQQAIPEFGKNQGPFSKRRSAPDIERASEVQQEEKANNEGREKEWRGLKVGVLRNRIQRLIVLMNLSEPGTIPDAEMLASLIDLCDGKTVVARSMVLMECAMFVRSLCSESLSPPCTIWVQHNIDSPRMHNVTANIRKWAEAIGEKLRLVELRDKEMYARLQTTTTESSRDDPLILPEEPVIPDEHGLGENKDEASPKIGLSVSYALKMAACNLLLEITRFLRDIPSHFAPVALSQVGTPLLSRAGTLDRSHDRKISNASVVSSEIEYIPRIQEFKIPHFGSSLSVEEPEPQEFMKMSSIDEGFSTSPRKKRASVYLHVNAGSKTSGGSLSRKVSTRRVVRLTDSTNETRGSPRSGYTLSSPSIRHRRRSVSSSTMQRPRKNSVHTNSFLVSSQTSHITGTYQPIEIRRKSIAVLDPQHDLDLPPPTTPSTPNPSSQFSLGGKPGAGGASSLGNSLNIGFTKLKRSAQRAFRRHGTKARNISETASPNSSPSPMQRKKMRTPSESYSQKSVFYPQMAEETWRNYPWLDMVEHLILIDASNKNLRLRNRRSCQELITALKKVYSSTLPEEEDSTNHQKKGRKGPAVRGVPGKPSSTMKHSSSLGSIFIHRLTLNNNCLEPVSDGHGSNVIPYSRGQSFPERTAYRSSFNKLRTLSTQAPLSPTPFHPGSVAARTSSQKSSVLGELDFTNLSYRKYMENLMLGTVTNGETIQLAIEDESPFEKSYVLAQSDKSRRKYINHEFAGLMHVLFSTLVRAAPVLHPQTFPTLKGVAWDSLLSMDSELSQVTGAFFLLTCAKESVKSMRGFVSAKVLDKGPKEQRDAILRFKVLWECRYGVWPRMEERGQKKLNLNDKEDKDKNEQTIGYSLLPNLLGHPGEDIPLSPCDPISVCTSTTCDQHPEKCYRPTKLAPVIHADEISKRVHNYSVSGVSIPQEAGLKSNSVVYHGFDSEDANGSREWEAVDPTLFPCSLLPLIKFVIGSLVPSFHTSPPPSSSSSSAKNTSDSTQQQLNKSELARQVVWACMIEDPRLFFRPLLNRFSKLYMSISSKKKKMEKRSMEHLLADTLEPFHLVLQAFPKLPPHAAHILLNNFVGVVLQHTDQPYSFSSKIIQSVLTLITMVAPSVQGLDSKLLKGYLKKESCYTNIMTTARIRGVEKVFLVTNHDHYQQSLYRITSDMTVGHLIAEACGADQLSVDLLSKWYLVDESKELPLLSSMVIQDHYSVPLDNQHPTFVLQKVDSSSQDMWGHQMEQLFIFKMSEIMRVLFTTRLLQTGPEVERGFDYSEYALPNYRFIHNELIELNSFPRKALTSAIYEVGPSALQHFQLRSSDIMLKGVWVRFILQLISSASKDYDWSNSMLLFINVINGALLLHSEDHTILFYSLATILTAVTKFNSVFKKEGYQMIIPTLVQVYSLHIRNRLIVKAIKFIWMRFYYLNKIVFLLQVMAAASTLLSEEAASLSNSVSSKFAVESRRYTNMEEEVIKRLNAKALFELNSSLTTESGRPRMEDELNILHCCQQHLEPDLYEQLTSDDARQRLTIKDMAILCITLARWNPEAIRGMQVLVFLDHMMPLILPSLGLTGLKFITDAIQILVKGCERISKPLYLRGDILHTRKGTNKTEVSGEQDPNAPDQRQHYVDEDTTERKPKTSSNRKTSVTKIVNKILYNPNRKDMRYIESDASLAGLPTATTSPATATNKPVLGSHLSQVDHATYHNQFRLRRLENVDSRVLQLSRDSLLSIVSEFTLYFARGGMMTSILAARKMSSSQALRKLSLALPSINSPETRTKVSLDPPSVRVLVTVATQMIKQGVHNDIILQGKGLNSFFAHLLPHLDWTEAFFSSFNSLLYRLFRLFRQLQRSTNKAILLWDNLTNFLCGLTMCIHHNPQLVQGQDQHLSKLKTLLETVMYMQSGRGDAQSNVKKYRSIHRPLLESAPHSFADAVTGLAVELIAATNNSSDNPRTQSRFRYHISDLVTLKSLKEYEDFLMPRIILPLCIQLGLKSDSKVAPEDLDFMLQFVENKVEFAFKFLHHKHLTEQIFRALRVICCAFAETMELSHWHRIAQWIHSFFNRKSVLPPTTNKKASSTSTSAINTEGVRSTRLSSVSSSSVSPLESFISFHDNLLSFFESFLKVFRVPLFSLLYPLLWKSEPLLQAAKQSVKVDNPAQLDKVSSCIERCQQLQVSGFRVHSTKGRQQLLRDIQDDLRWQSMASSGRSTLGRSHTTIERKGVKKRTVKMRRNSDANLTKMTEMENALNSSSTLPRGAGLSRPKNLRLSVPRSSTVSSGGGRSKNYLNPNKKQSSTLLKTKKGVSSKPGLATIQSSPRRTARGVQHSPQMITNSSIESPDLIPKVISHKRRGRSPRPAREFHKGGSFEYQGDIEESEEMMASLIVNNDVEVTKPLTPRIEARNYTPVEDTHDAFVISNSVTASPYPPHSKKKAVAFKETARPPPQQTVPVEVHFEREQTAEETPAVNVNPKHSNTSSKSHDFKELDTSELGALDLDISITSKSRLLQSSDEDDGSSSPGQNSARRRKKQSKSPSISIKRLSLSQPSIHGDKEDPPPAKVVRGSESPYFAWPDKSSPSSNTTTTTTTTTTSGTTTATLPKAYSFNSNNSKSPGTSRGLGSALKEGKQFLYSGFRSKSESADHT